jgi:hypothetical protein
VSTTKAGRTQYPLEGSVAYRAAKPAHGHDERNQRERAALDIYFGGQLLVRPADCA